MQLLLSSSFSRGFALFYYSLLFLKFERGEGCNPCNPPLDPPMNMYFKIITYTDRSFSSRVAEASP